MFDNNTKEYQDLKAKLQTARDAYENAKKEYDKKLVELTRVEDNMISYKEEIRKATQTLEDYESRNLQNALDDDEREEEINRFRKRLPDLLKQIEEQDKKKEAI